DLRPRLSEVGPDDQRHDAAGQEEAERRDAVEVADDLVVRGRDDPDDALTQSQFTLNRLAAFECCRGCHQCSSPFSRPAISSARLAPTGSPTCPSFYSSLRCLSYSARETTWTLHIMREWYRPQSSAQRP